jgi:hypothetical protein
MEIPMLFTMSGFLSTLSLASRNIPSEFLTTCVNFSVCAGLLGSWLIYINFCEGAF